MTTATATISVPEPIVTRPAVMAVLTTFGSLTSFYLLLSVVPIYAAAGAGGRAAGLATGVMMLATVALELAVPRMLNRFGYRGVICAGLVLLGAPTPALFVSPALPLVLGVSLARGAGLGILVVAGTALAAELVPPGRRGEGLALYGVAAGVPSIVGLPLGLWMSQRFGYGVVFVAATVAALVPLLPAAALPSMRPAPNTARVGGGLRHLARPALIFFVAALAAGVVVTFVPLAVAPGALQLASTALLIQSVATPLARWWAGRFGDRHGHVHLLLPAVLATASGTALFAWVANPVAAFAGMALFGIGWGLAQNTTQALMFARVPRSQYGRASALWNFAYDGGLGVGAAGFGLLIGRTGYPVGFALTAALVVATLWSAVRERRA